MQCKIHLHITVIGYVCFKSLVVVDICVELEEAFFFFAYEKDRKIGRNEVGAVVRSVGLNPTEAQLKEMVAQVDRGRQHIGAGIPGGRWWGRGGGGGG